MAKSAVLIFVLIALFAFAAALPPEAGDYHLGDTGVIIIKGHGREYHSKGSRVYYDGGYGDYYTGGYKRYNSKKYSSIHG